MKRFFSFLAGIVLVSVLGGCVSEVVYVVPKPPAPRVEVIAVAPYPGAVWVPGYWKWHKRHHRYDWYPGYWRGHKRY